MELASLSCSWCRKQKRKCSRTWPRCESCVRTRRACIYAPGTAPRSASQEEAAAQEDPLVTEILYLRSRIAQLESQIERGSASSKDGSADFSSSPPKDSSNKSSRTSSTPSSPNRSPPVHLITKIPSVPGPESTLFSILHQASRNASRTATSAARLFFQSVHPWLCIISSKGFHETISDRNAAAAPDFFVLTLAMDLITQQQRPERQILYESLKQAIIAIEETYGITLRLLQSSLLVSFYELGNGLFTTCYESINNCLRMAELLHLPDKQCLVSTQAKNWILLEEEKRTWMAVIMLDRMYNLTCPLVPIQTPDPLPSDLLPVDDSDWDYGVLPAGPPLHLDTPANTRVGAFARAVQGAMLVGRTIVHLFQPISDVGFQAAEAEQLHRTLTSFADVAFGEFDAYGYPLCNVVCLIYSALLLLHEPSIFCQLTMTTPSTVRPDGSHPDIRVLKPIVQAFHRRISATMLNARDGRKVFSSSPMIHHSMYQFAKFYVFLLKLENESEDAALESPEERSARIEETRETLETIARTLRVVGQRWDASNQYAEAVEIAISQLL